MNPVRASLRFPQVTLMVVAMLFIAGLYALFTMPRREDPKITIHTGIVSAAYPGATVEEVEDQVTRKIEERLFRFSEVRREKTFSTTRSGLVVINVELNKSVKDSDEFWSRLRLDLAQLKAAGLPAGVRGPVVDSDFGDTVAVLIAVHGGHYGYRELTDCAKTVETALRAIPAVSKIKRIGDQKEEIDIDASTERLAQYAANPQRIMQALQGRNTVAYAGRVKSGVELEQATLEAGERRLRPIFLTSMAAAVGVTPMILSGSSLWSPLASVIAFGLLGSMFFTLVVIPVLFVVVHRGHPVTVPAKALVTAMLLLAVAHTACGQPTRITLDEAVALATKQNSTVKLAQLKTREMQARVGEAKANYFPVVSNESNAVHLGEMDNLVIPQGVLGTYPSAGPIPGKNVSIKLGNQDFLLSTTVAAQPITQWFKIHDGVTVAHSDAAIARDDAQRARDEVSLKVKQLYFGLLTAQRRHQSAELRVEAGEERLREARTGVESGTALELKALEGEAQVAEARHALGSLEDAISDMKVEFNDLTGIALDADVELVPPEPETSDATAGDLTADALAHNPEVAAARQAVVKARAGVGAARAEYIPEVGAFAQYAYQSGVPLLPENNGAVGLRMNWTLAEFGKRSGQVHERQAQLAQAEENLHQVEDRVRVDIEKEVRRFRRAETGLEAARESVAARTEMRRITANQLVASTVNVSALKEADAMLAEAEAGRFQAEMEQRTARAELQRTVGRE
jgi:outer membrane protein TolC